MTLRVRREASPGGRDEAVFRLAPIAELTMLYSFTGGVDGGYPLSLIQASDGYFFGTTIGGGGTDSGTVFRITPVGALSTVYDFTGGEGGSMPVAIIQAMDNDFHGTAFYGGETARLPQSAIFRLTSKGILTTLCREIEKSPAGDLSPVEKFAEKMPVYMRSRSTRHGHLAKKGLISVRRSLLQASPGAFFGTAPWFGQNDCGTIFQMTPSGALTILHGFRDDCDGAYPECLIRAIDGSLYGTTSAKQGRGTIFRIRVSD